MIHVGDIGVPIGIDTGITLTGGTNAKINYCNKLGYGSFDALISDTIIYYTTTSAEDINVGGDWQIQGQVTIDGKTVSTDKELVEVEGLVYSV